MQVHYRTTKPPKVSSMTTEQEPNFRPTRVINENFNGHLLTADAKGYEIRDILTGEVVKKCTGQVRHHEDMTEYIEHVQNSPTTNMQRAKLWLVDNAPKILV